MPRGASPYARRQRLMGMRLKAKYVGIWRLHMHMLFTDWVSWRDYFFSKLVGWDRMGIGMKVRKCERMEIYIFRNS